MRPAYHALISIGTGGILLVFLKSWTAAFGCILSGVFLDIDHFFDYFLAKKGITLSYRELENYCTYDKTGKLYLFFHSYEFLFLFWICLYFFNLKNAWIGLAVGASAHILSDQFANPLKPLSYFISYRIQNAFKREKLFTKKHWECVARKEGP